jgi:hypothetical protein
MKYVLTTLCLSFFIGVAQAQRIVPYKAILETSHGKEKGLLHKVDCAVIVLNQNGEFITLELSQIKHIKIRKVKKAYKLKTYLNDQPNDDGPHKLNGNNEWVNRFGNRVPTLEEEIAGSFFFAALNGVVNVIAFPIHAINPNLAKYKLQKGLSKNQLDELSYYSIVYQVNPNILAELRKMKEISSKAKSQRM